MVLMLGCTQSPRCHDAVLAAKLGPDHRKSRRNRAEIIRMIVFVCGAIRTTETDIEPCLSSKICAREGGGSGPANLNSRWIKTYTGHRSARRSET